MIKYYILKNNKLIDNPGIPTSLAPLVWVDMLSPEKDQEAEVEARLSIDAPTREEMHEIEISSRLYTESNTIYITATLVTQMLTEEPQTHSITFIFKDETLVTLRYSDPKAFQIYLARIAKNQHEPIKSGFDVFFGLMDAVVDRLSEALEMIGHELDGASASVFQNRQSKGEFRGCLNDVLKRVGRYGDLNGKIRESLLSLARAFSYLQHTGKVNPRHKETLETFAKDISSLTEHASFISNRVNLLLDATLGMINIEQNAIIKIFSVAAVVFLPPTLIASIYGMNFEFMPELTLPYGYPAAIGLMILSAVLPYIYFKFRRWL